MSAASRPALAPFPPAREGHLAATDALEPGGFGLRWLNAADLPWLRDLYASTRAEELAQVPWPAAVRRAFLDNQFALQHAHYVAHYGDAEFLAVERRGCPVGRIYLQRAAPHHLLVDIALFPAVRGHGHGRTLLEAAMADAASRGRGLELSVHVTNVAARRLYERLGFRTHGESATHHAMRWTGD